MGVHGNGLTFVAPYVSDLRPKLNSDYVFDPKHNRSPHSIRTPLHMKAWYVGGLIMNDMSTMGSLPVVDPTSYKGSQHALPITPRPRTPQQCMSAAIELTPSLLLSSAWPELDRRLAGMSGFYGSGCISSLSP